MTEKQLQQLKDSEEKYRRMIDQAIDAIFAIDTETGLVCEANPAAQAMTGRSLDELLKLKVWELHPAEEEIEAKKLFRQVVQDGAGLRNDLHILKKDGSVVAVDSSASVVTFGNKKIIQRICRDVTGRRSLENQNEYLRQYHQRILDLMPVGLGVRKDIATEPAIEFENRKLREMFSGDPCKEERNCCWSKGTEIGRAVKESVSDDGEYAVEREMPDGHVYQYTIKYIKGELDRWSELQIVQDVTRRRRLEEELQKANEDLEQKVRDRTRELREKQTQLVQAEKMASLGNLVAGVAHEINTPLAALASNNDLFIRAMSKLQDILAGPEMSDTVTENADIKNLFENIKKLNAVNKDAAGRIVKIVNSLRSFARLDQAEKDTVDIHEGLESTITLVQHHLKNRIRLHKEFGRVPMIECFPNQLNQVFMNLLVNAGQAIEGEGDIWIRTYTRDHHAVVEIRDTGKGISPENLKQIFDPGFTTKGVGVGTGLGLSIVHQIIRDHAGEIEAESEVGKGTVFRVILPLGKR